MTHDRAEHRSRSYIRWGALALAAGFVVIGVVRVGWTPVAVVFAVLIVVQGLVFLRGDLRARQERAERDRP